MPNSQRTILVTGASRGIGAEVAVRLAGTDRHVVVNYRDKARRADEIVERIRDAGGTAVSVRADLCDESAVTAMLSTIGRLDVLVLNASGGMERGADPGYAMRINRDAHAVGDQRATSLRCARLRVLPVGANETSPFQVVRLDVCQIWPYLRVRARFSDHRRGITRVKFHLGVAELD